MAEFALPDLGEGLTEAEVLRWLVAEGDTVVIDQPVVEVETAKAAVEVPIPYAGVVSAIRVREGATAAVGEVLICIDEPTGGSGNVLIGYGTSEEAPRRRRRGITQPAREVATRGVISPVVRRLARDAGIDLGSIVPLDGEVVCRVDVERAIAARHAVGVPAAQSTLGVPAGTPGVQRIPLTGTRGFVAEKLARSRREIPEATVWVDVDATALLQTRRLLSPPDEPISVLALLSRFVVAGLRRFPQLNARVVDGGIEQHDAVHLGFAAQTDRGLVVPVVHDAGEMRLRALAAAMTERTVQARDGALGQDAVQGGTFTVNNYGVFGVDGSAAIINHPEAAILGIGRIIDRPWVVDGEVVVRKVAQLTIAFDHRVCDGGVAGGFLRYVADCVENPATVLLDL